MYNVSLDRNYSFLFLATRVKCNCICECLFFLKKVSRCDKKNSLKIVLLANDRKF